MLSEYRSALEQVSILTALSSYAPLPLLVSLSLGLGACLFVVGLLFTGRHHRTVHGERQQVKAVDADDSCITSPAAAAAGQAIARLRGAAGGGVGKTTGDREVIPESVNFHLSRRCNYKCGFCFHTAKTSFELPLDEAKRGLRLLKDAGMVKVNFSGGEPFLPQGGRYIGDLVMFCKKELDLPSVSIVSNGSLIREKWFINYGEFLDILAVSCDSFDPNTNARIGRQQHREKRDHIESLIRVREWCNKYKVAFKVNSVVNTFNKDEDMTESILELRPVRWKVFQCLIIDGENAGDEALRSAEEFVITDAEFAEFIARHKSVSQLVPESNDAMRYSYLIVDEYMRFLNGGTKQPSKSILDVGVEAAIDAAKFDDKMFYKRGGKYTWSKADMNLEW